MPTPAQTYNITAGNREDILDLIQIISPEEAPIFSRLKDSVAYATQHQWVQDTLATSTTNAQVEGFTANASTTAQKVRQSNYCQILAQFGAVSGTQEAVLKVDIDSEYAYELKKHMKQWKLDAENVIILQTSAVGSTSTARTMTGLLDVAKATAQSGSQGNTQLSETIFNNLLQTIFENGAVPKVCFVAGWLKRKISQFATSNTRYINAEDGTLINVVNIYQSDFGQIEVFLDRYIPKGVGLVMNDDYFRLAWLRKPRAEELAKVGDLRQFQIVGELTLEYLNQNASGVFTAFATN